jgi:hypothetical protein
MNVSSATAPLFEQRLGEFKRIVEGYLLSIVCICGLLGNALTCVILSSRVMRTSTTNIYIFALSCSSSCVLIGFLLTHGIRSTFHADVFHRHIFTIVFPIHVTCLLIQIYLTATVAVDRFILICLPFRGQKWRSPRHAIFVVFCVTLFCIFYCVPFWFEYTLIKKNDTQTISISKVGAHPLFRTLMRKYLYFVFVFLIPLSTIIICKAMIIKKLYSVRKRKRLLGNSSKQNRSSNAINFLLLSIVFVFLITQLPYFVFNVLYSWFGPSLMRNLLARQYLVVNNLLSVINASSTFILYAFFDRKFRQVGEHFLFCRPLPASFGVYAGRSRSLISNRHASFFVSNAKTSRSSTHLLKNHRFSATTANNIHDLTKQQLVEPKLTSTKSVPIFENENHAPPTCL